MVKYRAAFLDLDGTLVDTTFLHAVAWSEALRAAGQQRPTASVHALIGMGGTELLTELLGHDDQAIQDAHGEAFRRLVGSAGALPGACELIDVLHDRQIKVVLVTSSKPGDLPALLDLLGSCRSRIDEVVHGEEGPAKPAPDLFRLALERCQLEPSEVLAVGDAEWDLKAAGRAGIAGIGVRTGGIAEEVLAAAGALAVYDSCAGILEHWRESPFA